MKWRMPPDYLWPRLEAEAAWALRLLPCGAVAALLVGQGVVGAWPQALGWRSFGRGRRQDGHMPPRRHMHLEAGMPTRPLAHQQDLSAGSCADGPGSRVQGTRERGARDGGREPSPWVAGPRGHKGVKLAPRVALRDGRPRVLAMWAPDPTHNWLEPDAVWVGGPACDGIL